MILDPYGRPARRTIRARYEAAKYQSPGRSYLDETLQDAAKDLADEDILEVARKAQYLWKNSPFVHGLVERIVSHVIGTGLWPYSASSDPEWNRNADLAFRDWAEHVDRVSGADWAEYQDLAFRAAILHGDAGTVRTEHPDGAPALRLIEKHQITRRRDPTTRLRETDPDGIDRDSAGTPTAYYYAGKRIAAPNFVLHLFPQRAAQYRGVSILAAAVNSAHDLDDILALEKAAVKEVSGHTDIVSTRSGELDPETLIRVDGADSTDPVLFYRQVFGPTSKVLRAGDTWTPYKPERPSPAWAGFVEFLAGTICISTGLPPSFLLGVKVGGADTRRDLAIANRTIERFQLRLQNQFARVRNWIIETEFPARPADWQRIGWDVPRPITADNGRDAKTDMELVRMGLMTRREWFAQWGQSWTRETDQVADEALYIQQLADEHGLDPATIRGRDPQAPAQPVTPEPPKADQ